MLIIGGAIVTGSIETGTTGTGTIGTKLIGLMAAGELSKDIAELVCRRPPFRSSTIQAAALAAKPKKLFVITCCLAWSLRRLWQVFDGADRRRRLQLAKAEDDRFARAVTWVPVHAPTKALTPRHAVSLAAAWKRLRKVPEYDIGFYSGANATVFAQSAN
jgi:hypothetical protein